MKRIFLSLAVCVLLFLSLGCDVEQPVVTRTNIDLDDYPDLRGMWKNTREGRDQFILVAWEPGQPTIAIVERTVSGDTETLSAYRGFAYDIRGKTIVVLQSMREVKDGAIAPKGFFDNVGKWAYFYVDLDGDRAAVQKLTTTNRDNNFTSLVDKATQAPSSFKSPLEYAEFKRLSPQSRGVPELARHMSETIQTTRLPWPDQPSDGTIRELINQALANEQLALDFLGELAFGKPRMASNEYNFVAQTVFSREWKFYNNNIASGIIEVQVTTDSSNPWVKAMVALLNSTPVRREFQRVNGKWIMLPEE
jgi:hypothetical protein